ncbi:MAG: hypothetical protein N2483_11200 [Burkholderiaceae bacterium]|nr:hypothetical protein [Burkholderiaceae bacterium]
MRDAVVAVALTAVGAAARAQDAARRARLCGDTAAATAAPVAACRACHSDVAARRAMLSNRGVKTDDTRQLARWLPAVIEGAQPARRSCAAC